MRKSFKNAFNSNIETLKHPTRNLTLSINNELKQSLQDNLSRQEKIVIN